MGSNATNKRKARRLRARAKGNPSQATDQLILNSGKATGAQTDINPMDVQARTQNWQLVQTPPRNLINQICWIRQTYSETVAVLASGVYTEKNVAYQANNLPSVSTFLGTFDQFCIYAVTTTVSMDSSTSSSAPVTVYTAIDYDNVASIGLTGIESYSNLLQSVITPTTSVVRFIKPCVATNLYGSSGFGSYGTTRCWINSNSGSTQHFGFRSVFIQPISQTIVRLSHSFIIGLRNAY